jgi:hypothetical protein
MHKQTLEKIYGFLGKKFFYRSKSGKKKLIFRKSIYAITTIKNFLPININILKKIKII